MICQVSLFSRFLLLLSIPQAKPSNIVITRLFFRPGKDQKSPSVVPVDFTEVGNTEVEVPEDGLESESIADSDNVTEASDDPAASPQESLDLVDSGDLTEIDGTEVDWDPLAQESLDDLKTDKDSIATTQKVLDSDEESADTVATGADGANGADGADGADAVVPTEPVAENIPDVEDVVVDDVDGDDPPTEETAELEGDDETIAEKSVVDEEDDNSEVVDENPDTEVVDENSDTEEVAEDIDETEDEDIEEILVETPVLLSEVTGGLGTVTDPLGKLSVIWKFDGGAYEGQVGVVSTTGMENYDLNSIEFMQEAIRRALTNIVVDDTLNGSEFGGWMNGEDSNHGEFTGVQTVQLSAGEQFFLALIPNGTFADVFASLESGEMPIGSTRPLFSLTTANPENTNHFVQLVDLTGKGNIFALEDIRGDEKSDWDLNDIIITIKGAEVDAASLDDLIERGEISENPKWMEGELGKAILESAIDDLWIESENLVSEKYNFPKEDQPLIGFIDTHFTANNPDLDSTRITLGGDYIENDSNPTVTVGEGTHGDHVLGIVGATQNNGIGINGINDDAPLWVSSAVGSGKWEEALTSFVEAVKASGQPTGVINLSIDLTQVNSDGTITTRYEFTPAERSALELARQNDILVVVSIGNEAGVPSVLGQASQEFHNIITVGAAQEVTLPDGTVSYVKADYSNYGDTLDIVAPGGTATNPVVSTVGDGVGSMSGTSVATAKVTGAASLIRAANPELNAMQVIEILKRSATDINTLGWDAETGAGLLNIAAAVSLGRITQGEEYKPLQKDIPLSWGEPGKPVERAANASTGSSILISKNNQGVLGNFDSIRPSMSADGNIIAYESYSSDLVSGDTNGKSDIFVFNRTTGQTSRVNVSSSGAQSLNSISEASVVSADGRFVTFLSNDKSLVPGIPANSTGFNLFVRDLVNNTTEVVSVNNQGIASGQVSYFAYNSNAISGDGRYVTFSSSSSNLVGGDSNGAYDIFVRDRQLNTTTRVNVRTNGAQASPSSFSGSPVISDDGKYIAFISGDGNLAPGGTQYENNIYIRNLVSGKTDFVGIAYPNILSISGKGEKLVFATPGLLSIYETATGKVKQINNLLPPGYLAIDAKISQNGRYVTFASDPLPSLPLNFPTGGVSLIIYRYDLETNELVAIQTDNSELPSKYNRFPAISADGRYITYESSGTNLAANDTNNSSDIVFHDTQGIPKPFGLGKIDLVASSLEVVQNSLKKGEPFDVKFKVDNKETGIAKKVEVEFRLVDNQNKQYYLGTYTIDSLAGGSSQEIITRIDMPAANDWVWQNLKGNLQLMMVVDPVKKISETDENNFPLVTPISIAIETGTTTQIITTSSSNQPTNIQTINSDSSLIVYDTDTSTYVYNTVTGQKEEFPQKQNSSTGYSKPIFSSDGNTYLYLENDDSLFVYDRLTGTKKFLAKRPGSNTGSMPYWMSESGRYITYAPVSNGKHIVYVYDKVSDTTSIDSKLSDFMNTYQLSIDSELSASADDSKVTFTATTYNPITQAAFIDLYLYDKNAGVIKKITSTSQPQFKVGTAPPPTLITDPLMSSDGKFVVFTSLDPSLVGAGNNRRDIFIYEVATGITKKAGIDNSNYSGGIGVEDISKDGRYILFSPDNGIQSLYVYDTVTGKSTQINVDANGVGSLGGLDGFYGLGKITEDGKRVAFISKASDLVAGDTNGLADIFIRDWQPKNVPTVGTPDLVGQSLNIPSAATAGGLLDTQFKLRNNGDAAATFRVGFYISQDGNISKADKLIGYQTVDSVPANGSTPDIRTILSLPPAGDAFWNGTGQYYIGMIVDDEEAISESNETNNVNQGSGIDFKNINITVPVQGDLSASTLSISKSSMSGGEALQASVLVANNTANSMNGFQVGFYISDSPNITKNDRLLGTQTVNTLAGNTGLTVGANLTLPTSVDVFWKNPGTYYIGAIVDDKNQFNESSEANNIVATPFEYRGIADPSGGYFNIANSNKFTGNTQYFDAGDIIQTQFQVNNNSSGQTGPVKVSFYMSEWDKYRPTDPIIASYTINSIAGNATSGLITQNIQLPTDLAAYGRKQQGIYKIGMIIDPDDSLKESNESNNFSLGAGIDSKDIMIMTGNLRLPDLTGNIVSAPASLKPGDSFNLQYTLSNSGGGAASSFQPNFYLVDLNNPNVGFSLKELSKIPAISLPSNSSSGVQNIQLTLPEVWVPFWQGGSGNYAIQMVADSLDRVTEFNERNNETNYPVQINYIPIFGAFLDKWRQNPSLGLPKGSIEDRGNGIKVQNFANGYIYSDNTGVYVYKTGGAGQGNAKPVDPSYQEKIVPGTTKAIANSGRWIYDGYLNKSQDNLTFRVDKKTNLKFSLNDVDAQLSLFRGSPSNGAFVADAKFQPSGGYYYADVDLEPGDYTLSAWPKGNASANYQIVTNFTGGITSLVSGKQTISTPSSLANQVKQISNPYIPLPSSQNIKENWGFLYGRREFQTYYSNGVGSPDWFEFQVDSLTNPKDMHTLQFALRNGNDLDIPNAKIQIVDTNGRVLNVDRPGEVPIAVLPNGKYYVKVTPSQAGMNYKVVMNLDSAKDGLAEARDLGKLSGRATFHDFVGSSGDAFGDTYRFQVEKDSFVRFKVNTKDVGGDADITLMNSSGQVLVQGNGDNYGERQLGAGTYFLKVVPTLGRTNYELVTQVAETLGEMYGRREEFSGKSISSGYADAFYSFNLAKQTDLSMALKNLSADVDFELRLDNGTGLVGSTFIASNDGGDQFGVTNELKYYRDLAAGKYFVRVINKNNVPSAKYDLVLNGSSNITQENIGLLNGKKEYSAYVGNASSQRSYTFTVEQAMKVKFSLNKPGNNPSDSMNNVNLKLLNASGGDEMLVNPKKDNNINYAEAELKPGTYTLLVNPSGGGSNYRLAIDPVIPAPIVGGANLAKLLNGDFTGQYITNVPNSAGPHECWNVVAFVTGQTGLTTEWKRGTNVMSSSNILPGTPIATFLGPNGSYDNRVPVIVNGQTEYKYIQHTGIFAGYGVEDGVSGFYIWDQNWLGAPIQKHFIKAAGLGTSNANNYYAIQFPTQTIITLPPVNPSNISVGEGLNDANNIAKFQAAYKARITDKNVGGVNAIGPAFRWDNGWIQEFQKDNHKFVLTLRDGSSEAFWLIGDNRKEYDRLSSNNINLGYALSNEYMDGDTLFADFEHGRIASKNGKIEVLKPNEQPSWRQGGGNLGDANVSFSKVSGGFKPGLQQLKVEGIAREEINSIKFFLGNNALTGKVTLTNLNPSEKGGNISAVLDVPYNMSRGCYNLRAEVISSSGIKKIDLGLWNIDQGYSSNPWEEKLHQVYEDFVKSDKQGQGIYYEGITQFFGDYVVDPETVGKFGSPQSEGFYAVGLIPREGSGKLPVLVSRGTQPKDSKDIAADTNPIAVGFDQFQQYQNEISNWLIKMTKDYGKADVIGHSLGGALTQLIAAKFPNLVSNVITFNSPGINSSIVNNFPSESSKYVTHYIVDGDIVSLGGEKFLPGTLVKISADPSVEASKNMSLVSRLLSAIPTPPTVAAATITQLAAAALYIYGKLQSHIANGLLKDNSRLKTIASLDDFNSLPERNFLEFVRTNIGEFTKRIDENKDEVQKILDDPFWDALHQTSIRY